MKGTRDKIVFDALMIENFKDDESAPVYRFKAELCEKESMIGDRVAVQLKSVKNLPASESLPELWQACKQAAAGFEKLDWKKIIVVGLSYAKGAHDPEKRRRGGYGVDRHTEIVFDFVVGEQAGAWFRNWSDDEVNDEQMHRSASSLLSNLYSSFSKDEEPQIFILPFDQDTVDKLAMLRDKFHQLVDALKIVLTPKNIHKFLAQVGTTNNLLTFNPSK